MDWPTIRSNYQSMLSDEGFRSEVDGDGDLHFRYEGGHYYITQDCDAGYFTMIYPNFWKIENNDEKLAALIAANTATRKVKGVKVCVYDVDSPTTVGVMGAAVQCFITDQSEVRQFLERGLEYIQYAVDVFTKEMRSVSQLD